MDNQEMGSMLKKSIKLQSRHLVHTYTLGMFVMKNIFASNPTRWEKIFAIHLSDKNLFLKVSEIKRDYLVEKWENI